MWGGDNASENPASCIFDAPTAQTPHGGPLSPFLANILLDDQDVKLKSRRLNFLRYADDFVIFTKSLRAVQRVFASVTRNLTQQLRLVVDEPQSKAVAADGLEFSTLSSAATARRSTLGLRASVSSSTGSLWRGQIPR